jgi:iron complex transport system substrate-binding protein
MPYTISVPSGSDVSFSFQSNVTTTVADCLFMLSNAPSFSSTIVTQPTTISATYGRAIIDYSGTLVKLPQASQINRIADSWAAHNTIVVLCGDQSDIVATTPTDTTIAMFNIMYPNMATMSDPFDSSGNPNMEQLLADNPDIVFMSYSASTNSAYQTMVNGGLCVVRMYFATFPDMLTTIQQTGWILGPSALAKANAYVTYFNSALANVTAVTSQIPQSQKVTVMHISGTSPLYVDGANSLIDTWITTCGGINAASSVSGNMQQVTLEQELAWNPQVIFVGSATATSIQNTIMTNPQYASLSAVQNNKVIVNPMGVFDWSRYSIEEALNIQWVAQTLYPNLFPNLSMATQTKYFYQTFYGYTLSNDQVQAILSNTTPPPT